MCVKVSERRERNFVEKTGLVSKNKRKKGLVLEDLDMHYET